MQSPHWKDNYKHANTQGETTYSELHIISSWFYNKVLTPSAAIDNKLPILHLSQAQTGTLHWQSRTWPADSRHSTDVNMQRTPSRNQSKKYSRGLHMHQPNLCSRKWAARVVSVSCHSIPGQDHLLQPRSSWWTPPQDYSQLSVTIKAKPWELKQDKSTT